eukprot:6210509-Pleurochrysis_carterae.AAC.1
MTKAAYNELVGQKKLWVAGEREALLKQLCTRDGHTWITHDYFVQARTRALPPAADSNSILRLRSLSGIEALIRATGVQLRVKRRCCLHLLVSAPASECSVDSKHPRLLDCQLAFSCGFPLSISRLATPHNCNWCALCAKSAPQPEVSFHCLLQSNQTNHATHLVPGREDLVCETPSPSGRSTRPIRLASSTFWCTRPRCASLRSAPSPTSRRRGPPASSTTCRTRARKTECSSSAAAPRRARRAMAAAATRTH